MSIATSKFIERRQRFSDLLKCSAAGQERWAVCLINDVESERTTFRSESSFYYLTGLHEPGAVLVLTSDGASTLYMPEYAVDRGVWVGAGQDVLQLGFSQVKPLGSAAQGVTFPAQFQMGLYDELGNDLSSFFAHPAALFIFHDSSGHRYIRQADIMGAIVEAYELEYADIRDVSTVIHELRREKSDEEILAIGEAVQITTAAHLFASRAIKPGTYEYEIRAAIESVFGLMGSERPAFPTIVGSGINGTRLHYTQGRSRLCDGDLVVIDCGAEYKMYASDISRTYPVSGMFTPRQREIYQLVLDVQVMLEQMVKPGLFIFNADAKDASLHHMAVRMFEQEGLSKYFPHAVGHFMGLDTHDVGDRLIELVPGDVITLEPGLYLPEEQIGVRIEDNYVVAEDGAVCLSSSLPKKPDDIERLLNEGAGGN
jgi:Xaa-Pro aminopeptidase